MIVIDAPCIPGTEEVEYEPKDELIVINRVVKFRRPGSDLTLNLYDISGRLVMRIIDGWVEQGEHEISIPYSSWNIFCKVRAKR